MASLLAAAWCAAVALAPTAAQAADIPYNWGTVKIGGSGYVTGMIAHPSQYGLFYARTDVGGSYRYDNRTRTWIALNDWTPPSQQNLSGIESIAVDPNDASKLYMVAGMYYGAGPGALLISTNQGATFTQVALQYSTGANWSGRQVGERLQVDPNQGNILFNGTGNQAASSATNGLWKSVDGGYHWSKVSSFPALSSDNSGAGVAFVAFQRSSATSGQATPVLFAAINTKPAAATGTVIYKSTNGGNSWTALPPTPAGLLPQRGEVGPDKHLYVTFSRSDNYGSGDLYGPDGLSGGRVYKYNITNNVWTNITPPNSNGNNYGFVGLSVHPTVHGMLLVKSINRYDEVGETLFRSTDGGASWTTVNTNASFDTSAAPWMGPRKSFGNWGGALLDPHDTNHAFVHWGGGVLETTNLSAQFTNWRYGMDGIEETAVAALISPTANEWNAYPVISGNWDICGFAHASLTTAPTTAFTNPGCTKVTSLDYARNDSKFVVRVGHRSWDNNAAAVYGAISWNGGYDWVPFHNNGPTSEGGGKVAVAVDRSTILWAPPDVQPVYSHNASWSWNMIGSLPAGVQIAADGYAPGLFYAYDRNTGAFYASSDKAVTWWKTNASLVQWADQLAAVPGRQGDLWLATWNGLYRTTSSGWGAWSKNAGVQSARAIGFGKEAPGASYPAIYLSGRVNNVDGIFRSTDAGASWNRINDDQHQWGGTRIITGDPKKFGTVYLGTDNGRGIAYGQSDN
jgi:hypothetical protein